MPLSLENFPFEHIALTHFSVVLLGDWTQFSPRQKEATHTLCNNEEWELLFGELPRPSYHLLENNRSICILRGLNFHGDEREDMISIRLLITPKVIYIAHRDSLRSLQEALAEAHKSPSAIHWMFRLSDLITEKIETLIFELDERADALEESILRSFDKEQRATLMDLRSTVIDLRRYLLPQRETFLRMARFKIEGISVHTTHDLYERYSRLCDTLQTLRERLKLLHEEITSHLNERTNHILYILSIISAIFLPLTFLTGLLGINVGGIPGAETSWAFAVVVIFSLFLGGGIFLFFKKKKWI